MAKQFPSLDLSSCTDYIVSVDNSVHRKANKEIFIFAVAGTCAEDEDDLTVCQGVIINEYTTEDNSPFDDYCKELASKYDAKVFFDAEY